MSSFPVAYETSVAPERAHRRVLLKIARVLAERAEAMGGVRRTLRRASRNAACNAMQEEWAISWRGVRTRPVDERPGLAETRRDPRGLDGSRPYVDTAPFTW